MSDWDRFLALPITGIIFATVMAALTMTVYHEWRWRRDCKRFGWDRRRFK